MKQHIIPAVFVILAAVLASVVIMSRNTASPDRKAANQPQLTTPVPDGQVSMQTDGRSMLTDETGMTSFIPLKSGETLLNILTIDFDGDNQDDQINLVRNMTSPYIYLLIGLYNSKTGTYDRTAEITTRITQTSTFSYNGMDIIGDHRLCLVYQGITDSGESTLQIFRGSSSGGRFRLVNVGDFKSNGTIFVQQLARKESYELSQSNGESFPVWVYSTPVDDQGKALGDQLQIKYEWNHRSSKYEETNRLRIKGRQGVTKEIARIGGSSKQFGEFLSGLWYRSTNEGNGVRYICFDYANSEIILLYTGTEEVYKWGNSYVSGNTLYVTSENDAITNYQRRYNITLVDSDEIAISMQDDLRIMIVESSSLWNGNYKRMSIGSPFTTGALGPTVQTYIDMLKRGGMWVTSDGTSVAFKDSEYTVAGEDSTDNGKYVGIDVGSEAVLSFRSSTLYPYFASDYLVTFAETETEKEKTKDQDKNKDKEKALPKIILQPVVITPRRCIPSDAAAITLSVKSSASAGQ